MISSNFEVPDYDGVFDDNVALLKIVEDDYRKMLRHIMLHSCGL